MKTVTKFVCELSGREYNTQQEAKDSEAKMLRIRDAFAFWKPEPKDEHCEFTNGTWCYQRTKEEYDRLVLALVEMAETLHPWIVEDLKKSGKTFGPEWVRSYYPGRYLGDGGSDLNEYRYLIDTICPKCYRQYGQPCYASHCFCDGHTDKYNTKTACPTREII